MRWRGRRQSTNVDDRRGMGGPAVAGIGGLGLLMVLVISTLLGVDPRELLPEQPIGGAGITRELSAEEEAMGEFAAVVLADTEDVWNRQFAAAGSAYVEPTLVLFTGSVASACGSASAAVGPFYCPGDQAVFIDLDFFSQLQQRFGAPGDFAQAYVIAHEVGHHVQNLMGITGQVEQARRQLSQAEGNELSVRLELQADCLAGVWAREAQEMTAFLEEGDLEEALGAAQAIGDDTLQSRTQGHVVPDSFTHGTSEQRATWLARGLEHGSIESCDTFSGAIDLGG